MNRMTRVLALAGVLVVAVVGFILLRPADAPQPAKSPQGAAPAATSTPAARPAEPAPPLIRVRGGKPVGSIERINVSSGERVRFVVTSDAADEVHVHGYDITRRVPAGRPVTVSFPAQLEGVFEVEMHGGHEQIASVRVDP